MPKYCIWTIGCQMNKAESKRVGNYLELAGYRATRVLREADLVVLNTCVVRQSAEDKVLGMLGYLRGLNDIGRRASILVTGCFVDSDIARMQKRFPHVALFFKPGDYARLLDWVAKQDICAAQVAPGVFLNGDTAITAFIPIVQGCNNFCSYCIVPYRRGREISRPIAEIVCEVSALAQRGTREVTLLGQNVNSYGHDLPTKACLAELLSELNRIEGLARIRFLTSHPKDVTEKTVHAMASLDKVCEHINLPLQAGDNAILENMGRGYTVEQYRELVEYVRSQVPGIAISTDIIVGFPGEDEAQFGQTLSAIESVRFDTVHVAMYSPRPGTVAAKQYRDNVSPEIKKERWNKVETLQASIAAEINSQFVGRRLQVLVEEKKDSKWNGRSRTNKLVFFDSNDHCPGRLMDVTITRTSPWALQGELPPVS